MPVSKYAQRLPDAFRKDPESVNARLLELDSRDAEALRQDVAAVYDALDLFAAAGATLDLYGDLVGQKRGRMNDDQYRYLILTRIGRNFVRGDHNSVLQNAAQMFGCGLNDIALDDVGEFDAGGPCVVYLAKMPVWVLAGAGFTSRQAVDMVATLLPVGVRMVADSFEGTFCFGEQWDEYEKDAGFADDGQSIGGYFGLLLGEDEDTPLPL